MQEGKRSWMWPLPHPHINPTSSLLSAYHGSAQFFSCWLTLVGIPERSRTNRLNGLWRLTIPDEPIMGWMSAIWRPGRADGTISAGAKEDYNVGELMLSLCPQARKIKYPLFLPFSSFIKCMVLGLVTAEASRNCLEILVLITCPSI